MTDRSETSGTVSIGYGDLYVGDTKIGSLLEPAELRIDDQALARAVAEVDVWMRESVRRATVFAIDAARIFRLFGLAPRPRPRGQRQTGHHRPHRRKGRR